MSKPIETLIEEHRVIENVLNSLEAFTKRRGKGTPEDRRTAGQFARLSQICAAL